MSLSTQNKITKRNSSAVKPSSPCLFRTENTEKSQVSILHRTHIASIVMNRSVIPLPGVIVGVIGLEDVSLESVAWSARQSQLTKEVQLIVTLTLYPGGIFHGT